MIQTNKQTNKNHCEVKVVFWCSEVCNVKFCHTFMVCWLKTVGWLYHLAVTFCDLRDDKVVFWYLKVCNVKFSNTLSGL